MTFKIVENIMTPRAEAAIRGFVYRWRAKKAKAKFDMMSPRSQAGVADAKLRGGMKVGMGLGKWEMQAKMEVKHHAPFGAVPEEHITALPATLLPSTLPPIALPPPPSDVGLAPEAVGGVKEDELLHALAPGQP